MDCVQTVLQHRRLALAVIAAVTLLFAAFIPRLVFKTSIHDLIIEDLPENGQYESFKAVFGSEAIIRVVVKCNDVFDPLNFQKIASLEDAGKKINGVQRVIGLPGIKDAVDLSGNWPMEKFVAFVSGVDLFKHNLIADDHNTTSITLVLDKDADQDEVIDAIDRLIDEDRPGYPPLPDRHAADFPGPGAVHAQRFSAPAADHLSAHCRSPAAALSETCAMHSSRFPV